MEKLKLEKKDSLAVLAYHLSDSFSSGSGSSRRSAYYGIGVVPIIVFDGLSVMEGGSETGSDYEQMVPLYNWAAAVAPELDISLSLETADRVRAEIANTSAQALSGVLHLALVERHRPYRWKDMDVIDFVCRGMLPSPNGQSITLSPGAKAVSTQQFEVSRDWNYCSIVAFVQANDGRILQGAVIPVENTFPNVKFDTEAPAGTMWLRGSTHTISWSSSRPLSSVRLEYSENGGQDWKVIKAEMEGTGEYRWTVPEISSARCLLAVHDPYGGARAVAGPFAIGYRGDLNADGVVNWADRKLLIEYLLEVRAGPVAGADMNEDGVTDILDVIYLDGQLGRAPQGRPPQPD